MKRFDNLDFIIVDVDSSILPWSIKAHPLSILMKMCKITEKPVLASGFGLSWLVMFTATQGSHLRIINGHENGGPLNKINEILDDNIEKLKFLDP